MDWQAATDRNREALKRILLALVAMTGGRAHMPRCLYRACLMLLRPAESAVRRLIIVAAREMALPPFRPRQPKRRPAIALPIRRNGVKTGIATPSAPCTPRFSLFDPLRVPGLKPMRGRSVALGVPRLSVPGFGAPFPIAARRPAQPDDPIPTARLRLRLEALGRALDDLPAATQRFARWRSRVEARVVGGLAPRRFRRVSALRPGRPPGSRGKPAHEVHEVLADLHGLALWALERRDSS